MTWYMEDMIRNEIARVVDRRPDDRLVVSPGFDTSTLMEIRMDKHRYPRLHEYSRPEAVERMTQIVLFAHQCRNQQADEINVQFMANNLVDELASDMDRIGTKNITFEEISRVVKRAVLSRDMYGISFATLYSAIADYVKGEGHQIELRIREMGKKKDSQSLKDSIIAPMLKTYAGRLAKNSKI